jgi:hypothetical protein
MWTNRMENREVVGKHVEVRAQLVRIPSGPKPRKRGWLVVSLSSLCEANRSCFRHELLYVALNNSPSSGFQYAINC